MTQRKSIQIDVKAWSHPVRKKAFHKKYPGKSDLLKTMWVESLGKETNPLGSGCCWNMTFQSKLKVCRGGLKIGRGSFRANVKSEPKSTSGRINLRRPNYQVKINVVKSSRETYTLPVQTEFGSRVLLGIPAALQQLLLPASGSLRKRSTGERSWS